MVSAVRANDSIRINPRHLDQLKSRLTSTSSRSSSPTRVRKSATHHEPAPITVQGRPVPTSQSDQQLDLSTSIHHNTSSASALHTSQRSTSGAVNSSGSDAPVPLWFRKLQR